VSVKILLAVVCTAAAFTFVVILSTLLFVSSEAVFAAVATMDNWAGVFFHSW